MKLLCVKNVQDRLTGQNYITGETYEFTGDRAKEVLESIYFEPVKEVEKPKKKAAKETE